MAHVKITIETNDPISGPLKLVYVGEDMTLTQHRDVVRTYDHVGDKAPTLKPSRHSTVQIELLNTRLVQEESSPAPALRETLSDRTLTEEEIRNSKTDIPGAVATDLGKKVKEEASKMKEERHTCRLCGAKQKETETEHWLFLGVNKVEAALMKAMQMRKESGVISLAELPSDKEIRPVCPRCVKQAAHHAAIFYRDKPKPKEVPPPPTVPYSGIEGFIPELGATVRECLDCGCLVPGGPTRCKRCAKETAVEGKADKATAELLNKEADKMAAEEAQVEEKAGKAPEEEAKDIYRRPPKCVLCGAQKSNKETWITGTISDPRTRDEGPTVWRVCRRCEQDLKNEGPSPKETAELLNKEADKMAAEEEIRQNKANKNNDIFQNYKWNWSAKHAKTVGDFLPGDYQSIEKDLAELINKQSRENRSNTPDFVLAQFMARCLKAFEDAVNARDEFYGIRPYPGMDPANTVGKQDDDLARVAGPQPCPECGKPTVLGKCNDCWREGVASLRKEWPLHCIVCGKVIARTRVFNAVQERIAENKDTNYFIVKCQECGTNYGVTMDKVRLVSVEINPRTTAPCGTCSFGPSPVGGVLKDALNFEDVRKAVAEKAAKSAPVFTKEDYDNQVECCMCRKIFSLSEGSHLTGDDKRYCLSCARKRGLLDTLPKPTEQGGTIE